jgi:DNA-binding response OmpR family regulator
LPGFSSCSNLPISYFKLFINNKRVESELGSFFTKVDDAHDATLGIGYARLNKYDLVIVDTTSSIMSISQLVNNLRSINSFQNIILTTKERLSEDLVGFYELKTSSLIKKPFNLKSLLDSIYDVYSKINHDNKIYASRIK